MYESQFHTSCDLPEYQELNKDKEVHGVKFPELEDALNREDFEEVVKIQKKVVKGIDYMIYLSTIQ